MQMRKVWALAFLIAAPALAVAQQSSTAGNDLGGEAYQPDTTKVARSISGCLVNNGHRYIVAVIGSMPKQYRVIGGDTSPLRGKIGHTVEIRGAAGKSDPRKIILNYNMLDATTGVGYDTISADSVQDLLPNCSFGGFERDTH
jgi:hypothetical protein